MKHGFFRTQWFVYALLHGLLFIPLNWVDARADMRIISPADGATVLGQVSVSTSPSYWTDLYIDGDYLTSGPPFTSSWDSTSVADGAHTISVMGFDTSGTPSSYASVNVAVANDSGLGVMHINSPGNGSSVSGT